MQTEPYGGVISGNRYRAQRAHASHRASWGLMANLLNIAHQTLLPDKSQSRTLLKDFVQMS